MTSEEESGNFPCPEKGCGAATRYVPYTGGNEYTCANGHDGIYPHEGDNLPRATLLRTAEGTAQLRADMRAEIARRNGSTT